MQEQIDIHRRADKDQPEMRLSGGDQLSKFDEQKITEAIALVYLVLTTR